MTASAWGTRPLRAGPLSLELDGADLRAVCLGPIEIVRRLYVAVRDTDWLTVPVTVDAVEVDARDDRFCVRFGARHVEGEVDFAWQGTIDGHPDGTISYVMDGVAGRPFAYNRIGLCVLHPIREAAGCAFRTAGGDGPTSGHLPRIVGPQPFTDGRAVPLVAPFDDLVLDLAQVGSLRHRFTGEEFETEDQRNWTDASFKTYGTPLRRGFPRSTAAGTTFRQTVTITLPRGVARIPVDPGPTRLTVGADTGQRPMPVGASLGVAELSVGAIRALRACGLAHVRVDVRTDADNPRDELERGLVVARQLGARLEVALLTDEDDGPTVDGCLRGLDAVDVARVLVFQRDALSGGAGESTPAALVALVRPQLPADVPLFGGSDLNFCELNRSRPDIAGLDGLAYAVTPQVHASDDRSILETLEAQPATVEAAREIGAGRPIAVTPITLHPRRNTNARVGAVGAVLPVDPRGWSDFGAAFTVGTLAALGRASAASVTLYELAGPAGLVDAETGEPSPAARALAALAGLRGGTPCGVSSSRPLEAQAVACARDDQIHAVVANMLPEGRTVEMTHDYGGHVERVDLSGYGFARVTLPVSV